MTKTLRRFSHGKRHAGEKILVRWTIDERLWRDFISAGPVRARNVGTTTQTPTPPEPFPAAGIEVVIRDDAAFVGEECISSFVPGRYHGISVRGAQLEIDVSHEYEDVVYVLPISAHALAAVSRLAKDWTAA